MIAVVERLRTLRTRRRMTAQRLVMKCAGTEGALTIPTDLYTSQLDGRKTLA